MMDERTTVVDNIEVESEVEEVKCTEILAKKDKWQAIFNKVSFLFNFPTFESVNFSFWILSSKTHFLCVLL